MPTTNENGSAGALPGQLPPGRLDVAGPPIRWPRDRRLLRVRHFVEGHYTEPLPLERVAAVAGLERSYFSRYFHSKTGVCFHDWLRDLRIVRALALMREEDLTLTQIAFDSGFGDLRTFERACERSTGLCPKAARARLRLDN